MSNLANGRATLKFKNSALVQKCSSPLYSNFNWNWYIVCKLNKWPRNPTNNFALKSVYLVQSNKKKEENKKVNLIKMVEESHLVEKAHEVLVIVSLEKLWVLIISHHSILMIKR